MADVEAYSISFDGTSSYAQAPSVSAYHFGTGDFTIEAWVKPNETGNGGPVAAQMGADIDIGSGWGLFVQDDGRIRFTTFNAGGDVTAVTKAPTIIFDESWHHLAAVRAGVEMKILIDGVPQPCDIYVNNAVPPLDISNNLPLSIGATVLVGSQTDRPMLAGAVDEVRLWNRALLPWEIDQHIYHIVTIKRENLVAQYGFDDKTGADTSGKGNDLRFEGTVLFGDPAFYFVPEGQPFMAVQTRLMQDYHADASKPSIAPEEVKAIRVGLSPRNSDGTRRAADLTLTSDDAPVTLKTNAMNQLNLSVFLLEDSLVAPVIKVHADFMMADERIVVPLDRQLHFDLAAVTGPDLQRPGDPLLDPADFDAEEADAVAKTISTVMSAAVQHDMHPSESIVRSTAGTAMMLQSLSSRRVVLVSGFTGEPERENYLPVEMENPLLMPDSDLCRCHYLAEDQPVERIVIPNFMPVPHFKFDVKSRKFTRINRVEAQTLMFERMQNANAVSAAEGAVYTDPDTAELFGAESLWEQFKAGLLDIEEWVVSAGQHIGDGIKVVISYIVDGVTKVFDFVVATVREAVDFVIGMLRAIGVPIDELIDYLAAIFNPADILRTHRVFYKFLQETSTFSLACIRDLKDSADNMFDSAKTSVDRYLDDAIARLRNETAGSGTMSGNLDQPVSLQADYVNQHVAESDLDQPTNAQAAPSNSTIEKSLGAIIANGGTNIAALRNDNEAAVQSFISDAEGVMNQILASLLEVLKESVDLAISTAKLVVDAIFDFLIEGYQMILDMADCHIEIPVITWFYEEVVCGGDGSKLTFFNLLALGGALPVTVIYKMKEGKPPFTDAFEEKFATMTWQDYGFYRLPSQLSATPQGNVAPAALLAVPNAELEAEAEDWKLIMSYVQGGCFVISVWIWFSGVAANDLRDQGVLDRNFETSWLAPVVIGQFFTQLSSYPIYDDYAAGTPASLDVSIWALQWLPFAIDAIDVALAEKKPGGSLAVDYVDTVQNGMVGIWGIIHLVLFASLLVWEEVTIAKDPDLSDNERSYALADSGLKGLNNIATTFPEIAGFARYSINPWVKLGVVAADTVAAVGAMSVTLSRLFGAVVRHHVLRAR